MLPQHKQFRAAAGKPRCRQLRVQTAVAALDEPAAAAEVGAEEVDSESLYKRFAELIDASMLSFHTGDRVRWPDRPMQGGRQRRRQHGGTTHTLCSASEPPSASMSQVQGTVVRVDQRGAYVDIGGKSTAFCPTAELALANIPKARMCCFACLLLLLLLLCAASVACFFSWWFQPVGSHAHVLAASVAANCWRTGGLCQLSSPVHQRAVWLAAAPFRRCWPRSHAAARQACGNMPLCSRCRRSAAPVLPQSTAVVGPHTCRDFIVIREERSGDLTLSLKRLELAVRWR